MSRYIDFSAYAAPNQPGTDYTPLLSVAMSDAFDAREINISYEYIA